MKTNNNGEYVCEKCGSGLKYNGMYDAYYCTSCNEWAERACSDEDCCYCPNRPKTPLPVDR